MYSKKVKFYRRLLEAVELSARTPQRKEKIKQRIQYIMRLKPFDEISKGVVFETKSSIFVVGTQLPDMKIKGKRVVGLTTDSPLYRIFKGKKDGDRVWYGNEMEQISIF
ncbi:MULTISPECIES: hypothetical protein [Flammeovirga]|uniref:Uncharacterized protein n=1 Tax=Flammeovirga agarivorans TaxID=2726742 RepID=A0A7X8SL77_9BACT|nr:MULTISPECIES: hypothetical protein [Flammeovirga]NLR92172.1 hypothetical protein [Flammeovirga agarivorans]